MDETVHVLADEFLVTLVAQYLQAGGVAEVAAPVFIHAIDAFAGGVEQQANLLLTFPLQAFGLLDDRELLDFQ
jgi:hypothetical protein